MKASCPIHVYCHAAYCFFYITDALLVLMLMEWVCAGEGMRKKVREDELLDDADNMSRYTWPRPLS